MTEPNVTPLGEVPSARTLVRSTLVALAVAVVLLVTAVLPAEYGVDPTGIGRVLGLTEMGEIKMALAREAEAHDSAEAAAALPGAASTGAAATPPAQPSAAPKSDVTEVVLAPNQATEIKLVMRKDARVTYSWTTSRGVVNYDTHGDSPSIDYHGYGKATGVRSDEGVLTAAFDGQHGWFWRNRSRDTVVVTLRTNGDYQELKRM